MERVEGQKKMKCISVQASSHPSQTTAAGSTLGRNWYYQIHTQKYDFGNLGLTLKNNDSIKPKGQEKNLVKK